MKPSIVHNMQKGIAGRPLVLHSDNGSPMKAATFQATLERLGIQSSFSRPRVWVGEFVHWYNHSHLHSGINLVTPYQRHYGQDKEIMENRIKVYQAARSRNPERWTKDIRNWSSPTYVALNPVSEKEARSILRDKGLG